MLITNLPKNWALWRGCVINHSKSHRAIFEISRLENGEFGVLIFLPLMVNILVIVIICYDKLIKA